MDRFAFAGTAAAVILALTGCGGSGGSGGGGGGDTTQTAHFVDNAVTGLHYTCDGSEDVKVTEAQGALRCPKGAAVRFLVGDIELGETVLNDNTLFITPADLAGEGADENDNTVTNISRFLISLDADRAPDNGIQIDPASHLELGLAIDFAQDPAAFETAVASALEMLTADLPDGPFALVPEQDAREHVTVALYLTNAGLYRGTVSYDDATRTGMTIMVTRHGAVYGTNQTAEGQYAASGFDESDFLSTVGAGTEFKLDGSTGATYLVDTTITDSVASGGPGGSDYPRFEASRRIAFDPVYDQDLVEEFVQLAPIAIGIGEDHTAPFIINGSGTLQRATFGEYEGAPPSEHPENDVQYSQIVVGEVVATEGRTLRVLGLSMGGYLVDATIDLSGDEPTVQATWEHVYEDRRGETQTLLPISY